MKINTVYVYLYIQYCIQHGCLTLRNVQMFDMIVTKICFLNVVYLRGAKRGRSYKNSLAFLL